MSYKQVLVLITFQSCLKILVMTDSLELIILTFYKFDLRITLQFFLFFKYHFLN